MENFGKLEDERVEQAFRPAVMTIKAVALATEVTTFKNG